MKVLVLIGGLGPGGAERQARLLLTGLAARGVETHLACFGGYPSELALVEAAGVRVHRISATPRGIWPLRIVAQIRGLVRRHGIDVIQTFLPTFDLLAPLLRSVIPGVRVATSRRSLDEYLSPRDVRLLRLSGGWVDAIVANSQAVAESVARLEGHRPPKLRVIPNGIVAPDPIESRERAAARTAFGLAPDDFALLYLAHFRRGKGHRFLPQLLADLVARRPGPPRFRLLLAGDTEVNASYRRLAAEVTAAFDTHGVTERVSFLGDVRDPRAAFAASDLFLTLSESEGSPNSVLEAMAYGLPVVATAAGGTVEALTSGRDGLLVPVGAVEEAAAALLSVALDPERRNRLGIAARARIATDFSVAKMVDRYVDLYREIASVRHAPYDAGASSPKLSGET